MVVLWAAATFFLLYHLLCFLIYFYLFKNKKHSIQPLASYPLVSVIIPFRNPPEWYIKRLLLCLIRQQYPNFEVLWIDDHSWKRYKVFDHLPNNMRYLSLPKDKQGKKAAIHFGIQHAQGTFILTTDVDCTVPTNWIKQLLQQNADVVLGPVRLAPQEGFLWWFQAVENAVLMVITAGAVYSNFPHWANGANLGYKKSLFLKLGGFSKKPTPSGDDEFLLHKAWENRYKIAFCKEAIVETQSCLTWKALLQQRLRWLSKTPYYQPFLRKLHVFCLGTAQLCVILSLILVWFYPMTAATITAIQLTMKWLLDWHIAKTGIKWLGYSFKFPLWHALFYFLFYHLWIWLLVFMRAFFRSFEWKGRKYPLTLLLL